MYSYKLYQMPMSNISKFRSFDKTKENIKLSDYVLVYCGKLEYNEEDFLDEIFYILNMKRPIKTFMDIQCPFLMFYVYMTKKQIMNMDIITVMI